MKKTVIALALLSMAGAAQALVTYTGSTDQGVTTSDDDFAAPAGRPVLFGREVHLDRDSRVTFEAVFSEADYRNAFITIGSTTFSDVIDGGTYTANFEAGLLPFSFDVLTVDRQVENGTNQAAWDAHDLTPWFAVSPIEVLSAVESQFFIGLNDDGLEFDQDIDDYVIQVNVVAGGEPTPRDVDVPEPSALALLALGALGVGATRLSRRKG